MGQHILHHVDFQTNMSELTKNVESSLKITKSVSHQIIRIK